MTVGIGATELEAVGTSRELLLSISGLTIMLTSLMDMCGMGEYD